MSKCPTCSKEIPINKAFCSPECRELFFKKISVQIPRPFIERVYLGAKDEDTKMQELKDFANRHDFDFELVKEKADILAKEFTLKLEQEKMEQI